MSFDQQKKMLTEAMLELCPFVVLCTKHPGVRVPDFLQTEDLLVLRIGRDPKVMGMPDLILTEDGWSATIMARGRAYSVVVPWAAVVQIHINDPFAGPIISWAHAMKEEVAALSKAKSPNRPGLRVVRDDE